MPVCESGAWSTMSTTAVASASVRELMRRLSVRGRVQLRAGGGLGSASVGGPARRRYPAVPVDVRRLVRSPAATLAAAIPAARPRARATATRRRPDGRARRARRAPWSACAVVLRAPVGLGGGCAVVEVIEDGGEQPLLETVLAGQVGVQLTASFRRELRTGRRFSRGRRGSAAACAATALSSARRAADSRIREAAGLMPRTRGLGGPESRLATSSRASRARGRSR